MSLEDVDGSLGPHLQRIEQYVRDLRLATPPDGQTAMRQRLADAIRRHMGAILGPWIRDIGTTFRIPAADWPSIERDQAAAVERWARHIADPTDVQTYLYLQRHTRHGFIGQFPASRFLAAQMSFVQHLRDAFRREIADPADAAALIDLLDREFRARILHITDFFVEAREAEMMDQEASYRRLIEYAPACIVMADAGDRRIYATNEMAGHLLGYAPAELLGRAVTALHPLTEAPLVDALWQTTLAQGHAVRGDLHLVTRSGRRVPVVVTAGVIEYANRHRVTVIYGDLSERQQLEAQLVQSEKMAAIGQLSAGIAHELRNPLAIVRNVLYDLEQLVDRANPDVREDLRIADEEIARAQSIIKNLLEFSRASGVELEPVDVNGFVRRTLALMGKYMEDNGVEVVAELDDIPPCVANANAIRHILLNLVTNAVQAMPDGGTLRLETRRSGSDRIRLVVHDTGVGIPKEHLQEIFNPFFTTKAPGQGTGLGLSVVHSIVDRYRGEIQVRSEVGVGTTFTIELPCPCHGAYAQP